MKRRFEEIGIKIENSKMTATNNSKTTTNFSLKHQIKNTMKNSKTSTKTNLKIDAKHSIGSFIENAPFVKEMDFGMLLNLIQTLEKSLLKNSQMRAKYAETPAKFMKSEMDLSEAIKAFDQVTVVPKLYGSLAKHKLQENILELLSHENTDIVIDTINLLKELLEPNVFLEDKNALIFLTAIDQKNTLHLVAKNLDRLWESEDDSEGLFRALELFENIMEIDLNLFTRILGKTNLIEFLVKTIGNSERANNEPKYFCAELLANCINLWSGVCSELTKLDFLEYFTDCLSEQIRIAAMKPIDSERREFVNNVLDIISAFFLLSPNKKDISSRLMDNFINLIKKNSPLKSQLSAFNTLSSSLTHSSPNCKKAIEKNALKIVFPEFARRVKSIETKSKANKIVSSKDTEILEQIAVVFLQFFLHLKDTDYLRFIRKFEENDFIKTDKVIEAFDFFLTKMENVDRALMDKKDPKKISPKKQFLYHYQRGGFGLALFAANIAFLSTGGFPPLKKRVAEVLSQKDLGAEDVEKTLRRYEAHLADGDDANKPLSKAVASKLLSLF